MTNLSTKRPGRESFEDYRLCLRKAARDLETYRKGRMVHVSTEIVILPAGEGDPRFYRDLVPLATPDGKAILRGRTVGKTYRRFPVGRKRREWREILGAFA